jgi:hypothetical protein
MSLTKKLDIGINVILPLFFGSLIYLISTDISTTSFLKDHLADGLWAYSLISAVLIIWDRRMEIFWITVIFLLAILFELAQYLHLIPGTADIIDILVYITCFVIGIFLNKYFRKNINNPKL